MEDRERIERIGDLIHDYWSEWDSRSKKRHSLNDLAAHFGVNPTSLSYWTRRLREPDSENKQRLAAKIGYIKFYKAIGERPRMPDNSKAERAAEIAIHPEITDEDIDEMIEFLEGKIAERRKEKKATSSHS